jgi:hypothetical protein
MPLRQQAYSTVTRIGLESDVTLSLVPKKWARTT